MYLWLLSTTFVVIRTTFEIPWMSQVIDNSRQMLRLRNIPHPPSPPKKKTKNKIAQIDVVRLSELIQTLTFRFVNADRQVWTFLQYKTFKSVYISKYNCHSKSWNSCGLNFIQILQPLKWTFPFNLLKRGFLFFLVLGWLTVGDVSK